MIEVFCEFEFSAAHALPLLPASHKCHRLHGHNYRVTVALEGDVDDSHAWIFDYADLDRIWRERVHAVLDHQNINEVLKNERTTSEFLAAWIADQIEQGLPNSVAVSEVVLWETGHFGARWTSK